MCVHIMFADTGKCTESQTHARMHVLLMHLGMYIWLLKSWNHPEQRSAPDNPTQDQRDRQTGDGFLLSVPHASLFPCATKSPNRMLVCKCSGSPPPPDIYVLHLEGCVNACVTIDVSMRRGLHQLVHKQFCGDADDNIAVSCAKAPVHAHCHAPGST
jgi:hypothetical protein